MLRVIDEKTPPMGAKSWTLWGAGVLLIGNGVLCALGEVIGSSFILDFSQALAGSVGPSVQIGIGAGMIGIRRRQ